MRAALLNIDEILRTGAGPGAGSRGEAHAAELFVARRRGSCVGPVRLLSADVYECLRMSTFHPPGPGPCGRWMLTRMFTRMLTDVYGC
jgi:hypothetical protein